MKSNTGNEGEECGSPERKRKPHLDSRCRFPLQRLVDLTLGTGAAGPFTITAGTIFTLPVPVNVVSVTADADNFLKDPLLGEAWVYRDLRILLTFFADISVNSLSDGGTLVFQLMRSSSRGAPVPLGPQSTFSITVGLGTPLVVAHAFEYLDKGLEPGDYTYSVQLVTGSDVIGVVGGAINILSATLSVIAAVV